MSLKYALEYGLLTHDYRLNEGQGQSITLTSYHVVHSEFHHVRS